MNQNLTAELATTQLVYKPTLVYNVSVFSTEMALYIRYHNYFYSTSILSCYLRPQKRAPRTNTQAKETRSCRGKSKQKSECAVAKDKGAKECEAPLGDFKAQ